MEDNKNKLMVSNILKELRVGPNNLGYEYLKTAITACLEDEKLIYNMTKLLYPIIAEKHKTSAPRAERAIRHSIKTGINKCEKETVDKYFKLSKKDDGTYKKPTNSEYIATIADYIRLEMGA